MAATSEQNISENTESCFVNDDPKLAEIFPEELPGWHGYIEWEKYPDRCEKANEILTKYKDKFTSIPEFQFKPLPDTNPILIGYRWKEYHTVLGPTLKDIPAESWAIVQKEKASDMIHVLDFPYNGEPPRDKLMQSKTTPNEYHFVRNHGGIPTIDNAAYKLTIGGFVNEPKTLTLAELQDPQKFEPVEVTVTLQCSGTRRIEQIHEYPGEGDELINAPWGEGAIAQADKISQKRK